MSEFVYLTSLGYAGSLADKRRAYYDDLIAGVNPGAKSANSPSEYGFTAWTSDPSTASLTIILTAGTLHCTKINIHQPMTITNLHVGVAIVGTTLTADQCFAGLFHPTTRALLASTASLHTLLSASTGTKTLPLLTPYVFSTVPSDDPFVGIYSNGTTQPTLRSTGTATTNNGALTLANYRHFNSNTGLTTALPDPANAPAASFGSIWVGLS